MSKQLTPAASTAWRIVLIDDEEDIREVMAVTLKDEGFQVVTAPDGARGLRLCDQTLPQIVITDIRMPEMDGLQVLETLKRTDPDIEVIVATAFGEMDVAIRALQLDASDFITKPIGAQALHLALKRAQDRYTARKRLKDYTALLEKERAATSQDLMKTLAFQKNLIESSLDGILGCDAEDRAVIYSRSMERLLGYSPQAVLQQMSFEQFFAPGEAARLKEALAGEKYGGHNRLVLAETTLRAAAGHDVPVQVSAITLLDEGQTEGRVCFFRDLREIRKLEQEVADQARILHQDKMMSLGRLAASVVHEINNPLAGILNYLRLMIRILREGPLNDDRQEKFQRYLGLVESETSRCAQIVSNLLSFSRRSPPSFGPVQIDELLQRCVLLSRHKLELNHIRLTSNVQPDIPPVQGDFNQLQQCVINLIFNAVDAMPEGGILHLEGCYDAANALAVVTVKDSGPGIAPERLPHIFEPFFTTKNEGYGVGLGLSMVYGIMQRHKGRVEVDTRPGAGAAFILKLPVSVAAPGPRAEQNPL
ncbi:MAG: response regulator [Desulfobacterales bacterium]|nr:MAG: response regulator [Desulfobacterales bacterium]